MPGMVPGSQVIIIAGPSYDALTAEGIHLNVAAGNGAPGGGLGDEVPCAMMEGVAAYTQTQPEGSQPSTMDTTAVTGIETKKGLGGCARPGWAPRWDLGRGGRGVAPEQASRQPSSPRTPTLCPPP